MGTLPPPESRSLLRRDPAGRVVNGGVAVRRVVILAAVVRVGLWAGGTDDASRGQAVAPVQATMRCSRRDGDAQDGVVGRSRAADAKRAARIPGRCATRACLDSVVSRPINRGPPTPEAQVT